MKVILYILLLMTACVNCNAQISENNGHSKSVSNYQLDSLVSLIHQKFSTDKVFIDKFEMSQVNWELSTWSDFEMIYPESNQQLYYGSVFNFCRTIYFEGAISKRISFLVQWIDGIEEGDVCSGSIPIRTNEQYFTIEEIESSSNERELNLLFQKDTIVFDGDFTIEDFIKMVDVDHGVVELRELLRGDLQYYISIKLNSIEPEFRTIDAGKYSMLITYSSKDKGKSHIKKIAVFNVGEPSPGSKTKG